MVLEAVRLSRRRSYESESEISAMKDSARFTERIHLLVFISVGHIPRTGDSREHLRFTWSTMRQEIGVEARHFDDPGDSRLQFTIVGI